VGQSKGKYRKGAIESERENAARWGAAMGEGGGAGYSGGL